MKLTDHLIEAMRSEFAKSKKWYSRSVIINLSMLILSMVLVFVLNGNYAIVFGIILFVLPIAVFIVREMALVYQARAENIRRSLMLADALDHRPSDIELRQLNIELAKIDKSEPLFDKRYYDSKLPIGPDRLIDILSESVFFTHNLSRITALIFSITIFGGVAVLFIMLYTLPNLNIAQGTAVIVAKCVALVAVFLTSNDFAYLWRRYSCLSYTTKEILSRCAVLRKDKNCAIETVMTVMDDYNCAVMQSPPIPGIIYKSMLKSLNEAWRKNNFR